MLGAALVSVALLGCDSPRSAGGVVSESFIEQRSGRSELAMIENDLLISSRFSGEVIRYDPENQKVVWRFQRPDDKIHAPGALAVLSERVAVLYPTLGQLILLDAVTGALQSARPLGQNATAIVAAEASWWVADNHDQSLLQLSPDGTIKRRYALEFQPGHLSASPPNTLVVAAAHGRSWQQWRLTAHGAEPHVEGQWRASTQQVGAVILAQGRVWTTLQQAEFGSATQPAVHDSAIRPYLIAQDSEAPGAPLVRQPLDHSGHILSRPIDLIYESDQQLFWLLGANSNEVRYFSLENTYTGGTSIRLGSHPRAMYLDAQQRKLFIWESLDFSLAAIDVRKPEAGVIDRVSLAPTVMPNANWLAGAKLFHDATNTLASSGWMTCDSCHPDGGLDHQRWQLGDGLRDTPALGGSMDVMPLHWSGDRDELQDFEFTFRNLMGGKGFIKGDLTGNGLSEATTGRSSALDSLASYVESLPALRGQRGLTAADLQAGKQLYQQSDCTDCHDINGRPILDLDGGHKRSLVNVGTIGSDDKSGLFDVPTLYGLAFTAPYLHHGGASTLDEVLVAFNPLDQHGKTSHLTQQERAQLVTFLKSL